MTQLCIWVAGPIYRNSFQNPAHSTSELTKIICLFHGENLMFVSKSSTLVSAGPGMHFSHVYHWQSPPYAKNLYEDSIFQVLQQNNGIARLYIDILVIYEQDNEQDSQKGSKNPSGSARPRIYSYEESCLTVNSQLLVNYQTLRCERQNHTLWVCLLNQDLPSEFLSFCGHPPAVQ